MTPPSIWLPLHHRVAFLWLRGKSKKTAQEKGGEVGGENVKIAVIIRSRMSGPDFQCAFEHKIPSSSVWCYCVSNSDLNFNYDFIL
jgi:hypothetical protein